jgi:hypothetical protein
MKLSHANRRIHLYFGLALAPWFLMYGLSSAAFSHGAFLDELDKAKGLPQWTKRFEQTYEIAIPSEGPLRPVGAKMVSDFGLQGAYGAYRQSPNQINVYIYTFWRSTQLKYFIAEKKVIAEDKRFRWDHFLTGMHAKGGFEQGGLHNLWGIFVDLVCLGMLAWVISGLVMWWQLPSTCGWGWLAFLGGLISFVLFLLRL